jgi:hypothetical protein
MVNRHMRRGRLAPQGNSPQYGVFARRAKKEPSRTAPCPTAYVAVDLLTRPYG